MTTPTPPSGYQTWLGQQISSLEDGEFIVLTLPEPVVPVAPRKRGFFGRQEPPAAAPYLQFLRTDDFVASECSGARFYGGPIDIPASLDERIRRLGWISPQDPAHLNPETGNYERHWERNQTQEIAALAVETLKTLGARQPDDISFERNR